MQNLRLDILNGSAMRPQVATHGTTQTCWKLLGTEHTYSPDLASYFFSCSKSGHRKVIPIFYFPIKMSLIIVASNRNCKASGTGSYISIWPVAPRNRWHRVILSLSSFSELSESSLGNPRNSREKFWRSNGSTVLMMIINDSGSNSMSLWSDKFFLWRILKASWKEQSLTWKLKHKGPFELGQIHPHLVKCWSYILDMMVLFGFSSNGSSTDVFHISTLIPYDSIRDTPSCHHPLCHPPPLPPLKESIVIFILPKMSPKVQFSCMSFTKKNGHQQINKLEKRCPKNINCWMDPTVQSSKGLRLRRSSHLPCFHLRWVHHPAKVTRQVDYSN